MDERTFGEFSRGRKKGTKEKKTLDDVGFDRRSFVFPVTGQERERERESLSFWTKISAATCRNSYRATMFSLSTTKGKREVSSFRISRIPLVPLATIFATRCAREYVSDRPCLSETPKTPDSTRETRFLESTDGDSNFTVTVSPGCALCARSAQIHPSRLMSPFKRNEKRIKRNEPPSEKSACVHARVRTVFPTPLCICVRVCIHVCPCIRARHWIPFFFTPLPEKEGNTRKGIKVRWLERTKSLADKIARLIAQFVSFPFTTRFFSSREWKSQLKSAREISLPFFSFFFSSFLIRRSIALIFAQFRLALVTYRCTRAHRPSLSVIRFVSSTYPISIRLMISRERYIIYVGCFLAPMFTVHLPDWIYWKFFRLRVRVSTRVVVPVDREWLAPASKLEIAVFWINTSETDGDQSSTVSPVSDFRNINVKYVKIIVQKY